VARGKSGGPVLIPLAEGKFVLVPSPISPAPAPEAINDPRFQPGAYITDGEDLYCVQRAGAAPKSLRSHVLVVEDCRTNRVLELSLARAESTCSLVRQAPSP
jgi:hypothetical protein